MKARRTPKDGLPLMAIAPLVAQGTPTRIRNAAVSRLAQIETIEIHHLGPRRDEVPHELLLRIIRGVDLRDRPQFRVRAEDQIDGARRPFQLAGLSVVAFVEALRLA